MRSRSLFILILLLPVITVTAEILEYEDQPPSSPVTQIQSLGGNVEAIVYITTEEVDPNLFKQGDMFLQIIEPSRTWWVQPPKQFDVIRVLEFIDEKRLLVELMVSTASATALLDIDNKILRKIGGGQGRYIRTGNNIGLIELKGQKSYLRNSGIFWFTSLIDLEGNLVEIISTYSDDYDCILISNILNVDDPPPTLRQSLGECVGP